MDSKFVEQHEYADLDSRSEELGMDLSEILDEDDEFKQEIQGFLNETGQNFNQICFGAIALAQYYLEQVHPDRCGYTDFYNYWIEPVEYNPKMCRIVESALDRARKKIAKQKPKEKKHDKLIMNEERRPR